MACYHRFIATHRNDEFLLFPDWQVDYLFIGTFNPEWDVPNGNNADYFYGRSAYFWRTLSVFFTGIDAIPATKEAKIAFARLHHIGFTDLIRGVLNADPNSEIDRQRIFNFKDTDLELFGLENIIWNTPEIQSYINLYMPQKMFFTLLAANPNRLMSQNIAEVEISANNLNISTTRLHTPSGQGLGRGTPRINKLIGKWNISGLLPELDLALYPYQV